MSKYTPLWEEIKVRNESVLKLTFDDIKNILGFEIDHSFLNYKKELLQYGFSVDKISLKNKTVIFNRDDF